MKLNQQLKSTSLEYSKEIDYLLNNRNKVVSTNFILFMNEEIRKQAKREINRRNYQNKKIKTNPISKNQRDKKINWIDSEFYNKQVVK